MKTKKSSVFVLGLDGGSWNVLSALIEKGRAPAFKNLLEEGAHGKLKSIIPPISVPAWRCYLTGKDPGKLGIYSFVTFDRESYNSKVVNSNDFKASDITDVLGIYNKKSVMYKMFSTYPAKEINGVMVTDFPSMKKGTYPEELYENIQDKFGEIFANIAFTTNRLNTYKTVVDETIRDFEVIKWLITKNNPDFVHMSVPHTDGVQHFFWRDMIDPKSSYHTYIDDLWVEVDKLLGELLSFLEQREEDWHLFIISDHGFTQCKYRFNLANWLVKRGYLKLTTRGRLLRIASRITSLDKAYSLLEKMIKFLNTNLRIRGIKWGFQHKLAADISQQIIDFQHSKVIPLEGQVLYVNKKAFTNEINGEQFVSDLIAELNQIKTPHGENLFLGIYDGKELYNVDAPDVIAIANEVYVYTMPLFHETWDIPPEGKWTGMHDLHGIFFAAGKGIRRGYEVADAELVDLMPTVLQIFGVTIPKDISGKILFSIFEDDSEYKTTEPEFIGNYETLKIKSAVRRIRQRKGI